MTIASQTSRIAYTGDGATTAFAVPFYFAANADLVVILQDTLGNQTTQVLGTNYTLTGATLPAGGTCTFTVAPTTGYLVTIYRDPAVTQTTSYNNNDPFPAKSHEGALDKLTAIAQRLKDLYSRTLRQADGDATMTTTLGSVAVRKNRLLGFDANGNIVYAVGPTFVNSSYTGVADIESRAVASVTIFPNSVNVISTSGQTTAGDGGGNTYIRGIISSPGAFQDAGGNYWGLASVITSKTVVEIDTRATAATTSFASFVNVVETKGLVTAGDGSGAVYIRGIISSPGAFQDATGQYWGFANTSPSASTSIGPPQARLSLTSGVSITTSDVTGATTVYLTLSGGNLVSIYNGTNMVPTIITELSVALDSNAGHTGYHQSGKNFDLFAINDGGTIRLGTGPDWTTGAGAGSDTARGTGAGSTELQATAGTSGMLTNKNTITIRWGSAAGNTTSVAANKATYVGSIRTTGDGVTEDSAVKRFVFNAYNQSKRSFLRNDATATWTYSTATFRQANASTSNQVEYLAGLTGSTLDINVMAITTSSTATTRIVYSGIGIDSTSVNSATVQELGRANSGDFGAVTKSVYTGYALLGYHKTVWLEKGNGTDTQTWIGTEASGLYRSGIWGGIFQ